MKTRRGIGTLAVIAVALFLASGSGLFLSLGLAVAEAQDQSKENKGNQDRKLDLDKDPEGNDIVLGELIVSYKEEASTKEESAAEQDVGGEVQDEIPDLRAKLISFPDVKNERAQEARQQALEKKKANLEKKPNVQAVDYNGILQLADEEWPKESPAVHERAQGSEQPTASATDPYYSYQWGYPKINAPLAWDTTQGSNQTKVAVLDTGVQANHPDLQGKVVGQYDFINYDATAEDNHSHGTHVAGTVAANTNNGTGVAGTCPNCSILAGKVLGPQGATEWSVIDGINWAKNNGAKVINMSLGGPIYNANQQLAVTNAWNAGVHVVAAMGNEAQKGNPTMYPAAYNNVMAVANTDEYDNWYSTSSYGTHTDVAAPGARIYSTMPTYTTYNTNPDTGVTTANKTYYDYKWGTSMAAPHVAGLAGLMASQGKTNSTIDSTIKSTAADLGTAGWDQYYGKGRINSQAAVAGVSQTPTIESSYPTPYQKRVPVLPVLTVNFSEAMDKSTLTSYNVQLYRASDPNNPISIQVVPSSDGKSVGFYPNGKLKRGKVYEIVLWKDATGIKNPAGVALSGNNFYEDKGEYINWFFKTRP